MEFALSCCPRNYLDEFLRNAPRDDAGEGGPKKRQNVDEMPTGLAKKLTLKLRF